MPDSSSLFDELQTLATEQRNPHSTHIDTASTEEILRVINTEDHQVPIAVRRELPHVAEAVKIVVEAFENDGRLFYVGAGTSGRLGVVDASECPPTFGTDPERVQGLIAGGREAVFRSQEGAEDVPEDGAEVLEQHGVRENDVVCGVTSSGRTPFVVGAVEHARDEIGCPTLFVTTVPRADLDVAPDVAICPVVGPEVIMGSTRMKSGTAQKLVLNMITTAAMVRLGKVYENMMVDLRRTSEKLVERGLRTVMMVTGIDYEEADAVLGACDGHVKTAIVVVLADVEVAEARRRLDATDGFVRPAIAGDGTG
ncbi:N-acetylmuramic acid 6-phosphate etherase [Salinibacter altiplanensis]|uniref:N-acetylmuramic acid 6-phosphate etherase n=1 Tax=Salinibacter altiplanensis TaxID=1803181 RepID=UPI000C9F0589|nr:N-acetylmuramic acid 6-phosphate etherase [Salinibacter altiplanensis]